MYITRCEHSLSAWLSMLFNCRNRLTLERTTICFSSWSDNKADGARGGFGLTAEPHVTVETLTPGIISSITFSNLVVYFVSLLWALPNLQTILAIGSDWEFSQPVSK